MVGEPTTFNHDWFNAFGRSRRRHAVLARARSIQDSPRRWSGLRLAKRYRSRRDEIHMHRQRCGGPG